MRDKKKGCRFAAAKKGYGPVSEVLKIGWRYQDLGFEKNFKKNIKTIVGIKKGFYICTRLARKRAKERKKQVHRHIELTA